MRIALFNSTNVNYFVDHAVRLSKLLAEIALIAMVIFSALALGAYLYRRHTRKLSVTTEDLGNGRLRKTYVNGIIEEGLFVNQKLEGEGTRIFPGDIYTKKNPEGPKKMEGTFKDGKLDGQGNINFIDGRQYSGTFAEGLLVQGKKTYPSDPFVSKKGMVCRYEFKSVEGTFRND